jgi:hypothetical protein
MELETDQQQIQKQQVDSCDNALYSEVIGRDTDYSE